MSPVRVLSLCLMVSACGAAVENNRSEILRFSEYQLKGNDLPYKTISLTYDDGPGPRSAELVRYLNSQDIHATFFACGEQAVGRTGTLQLMKDTGHLVGNHSYSHPQLPNVDDQTAINEVRSTDNVIKPYTLGNMFVFRAPYADWTPHLAHILNDAGLTKYVGSIEWDIGTRVTNRYAADWECWAEGISVEECGQGYINEIEDVGSGIVLLHDIHSKTIDMTRWMIPRLKARGFKFVRIDNVPNINRAIRAAGGVPGSLQ